MSIVKKAKIDKQCASFHAQYASAVSIDVHSQILVGAYQAGAFGAKYYKNEFFEGKTTKSELNKFAQKCVTFKPEVIIMESTGVYWFSLYEALINAGYSAKDIAVVNARDVKNTKGYKTDRADAVHLAEIARQGTFKRSFIPDLEIIQLRNLWRAAFNTKQQRQRTQNEFHKMLTLVGCRASSVFSDVRGKMATKIIDALVSGLSGQALLNAIEDTINSTRHGRLKASAQEIFEALQADMNSMVWFGIKEKLKLINMLDESYNRQIENIKQRLLPYKDLLKRLMTIPCIKELTAIGLICELGNDLSSFSSIRKFCRWIGLAPGQNLSACKGYGCRVTKGNKYLKILLVECAQGVGLSKNNSLHDLFQKFKERRGTRRAVVAIAHKLARIIFAVITSDSDYQNRTDPDTLKNHRLEKLDKAVNDLKDVNLSCTDIEVKDNKNSSVVKVVKCKMSRTRRTAAAT